MLETFDPWLDLKRTENNTVRPRPVALPDPNEAHERPEYSTPVNYD